MDAGKVAAIGTSGRVNGFDGRRGPMWEASGRGFDSRRVHHAPAGSLGFQTTTRDRT